MLLLSGSLMLGALGYGGPAGAVPGQPAAPTFAELEGDPVASLVVPVAR